jgi:hypothetical protein
MQTNAPDRMNMRVLWILAVVGAFLAIAGWWRYFGF